MFFLCLSSSPFQDSLCSPSCLQTLNSETHMPLLPKCTFKKMCVLPLPDFLFSFYFFSLSLPSFVSPFLYILKFYLRQSLTTPLHIPSFFSPWRWRKHSCVWSLTLWPLNPPTTDIFFKGQGTFPYWGQTWKPGRGMGSTDRHQIQVSATIPVVGEPILRPRCTSLTYKMGCRSSSCSHFD